MLGVVINGEAELIILCFD